MASFRVQSYVNAADRQAKETAANMLLAAIHKLHGDTRTETVSLARTGQTRARAEQKLAEGTLGVTSRYSAAALAPTDPDDVDAGGEVRVFLGPDLQTQLDAHGSERLTAGETALIQAALAGAVER